MSLSAEEQERYKRHLLLPEVGGQGQRALKAARVLLVGAGGIGCPLGAYLAAAGVGHLRICDPDHVSLSNLQRQILFRTDDLGRPKVEAAAERLRALNDEIAIDPVAKSFTPETAAPLLDGCDLVVEGVDRYKPRYAINDACKMRGLPLVSGALGRFDGQVAFFAGTPEAACYRCFLPEPPLDDEALCETDGVLGAVPGVVGSLAALDAILFLTGNRDIAAPSALTIFSGRDGTMRRARIAQDPDCPVCRSASPVP